MVIKIIANITLSCKLYGHPVRNSALFLVGTGNKINKKYLIWGHVNIRFHILLFSIRNVCAFTNINFKIAENLNMDTRAWSP